MTKKLVKNIDRLFFNSLVYCQIGVPFKNTGVRLLQAVFVVFGFINHYACLSDEHAAS